RQQRPLVAVERPGPAAPGPVSSRPLDPGRPLSAGEEAIPGPGRQVSRPHHEPDLQLQGSAEAGARRDRQRDQRQGPDHRQADDLVRKPEDDGTTTTGDWIYTGSYLDSGNLMKRRGGIQDPKTNDPTGMGFYPNWSWSWPLNRRVMYNRASADLDGKPWDPARPGITWDGSKWVGDVPDYPLTMNPHDPNAWLPFIMNGEGVGRLFSNGMVDGPFPEHYEPVESPVANPLHPNNSASPVAFLYDKVAGRPNRFGGPQEF